MRCYPARRSKGVDVQPLVTQIEDLFQFTNSTIGKPFMLCIPGDALIPGGTQINTTSIPVGAMACYKIKDAKGTPKFPPQNPATVLNITVPGVGPDVVKLGRSTVFCLPVPVATK